MGLIVLVGCAMYRGIEIHADGQLEVLKQIGYQGLLCLLVIEIIIINTLIGLGT